MRALRRLASVVALAGACQGGGGGEGGSSTGGEAGLDIVGSWDDDVSGEHEIRDDRWVQAFDPDVYTYFISYFDNELRFVVARSANDMTWFQFEWVYVGDQLYYCASASGAASAAAAEAAPPADAGDPASGGCLGAPWHPLNPSA